MFRPIRRMAAVAFAILLTAGASVPTVAAGPDQDVIVIFRHGAGDSDRLAASLGRNHGFTARYVYRFAIQGFAARVSADALRALQSNPSVASVEPDGTAHAVDEQPNATWGLDRIDQRSLPLNTKYVFDQTGAGVTAYIIDTGIRISHAEFGGRASDGIDVIDGALPADDCHGHGTHVAGTVGGVTYGVAKGVHLVAVRVLDCSGNGTWSGIIAGIDWLTADHDAAGTPAVANMSLIGSADNSVDIAVRSSISHGVSYALAAGNGNVFGIAQDACNYSPARVSEAMTIGATDSTDRKASFSNYGNCVDWFAPGVNITSAWKGSDTATNTISGTSMASPHTAGVAALYLQSNPTQSAAAVRDALYAATTKGIVTSANTANNHLLYSLNLGSPTPTPTPTPTPGDTGLLSPSANAPAAGGDGNGYETIPINAFASADGLFAVDTNSGTNSNSSCTSSGKDKHLFRDYSVNIPNGVTIKGIEVRLDAKVDSTSGSPKVCVQLSWDGGVSWTSAKSTPTLTTTKSTSMLGSATDLWGHSWVVDDVSNANFRVRVIDAASSTSRDFSLDWVAVRVSY